MSEDPSTPRAPDLSPDVVQSHMARTAEHSSYATKQWEKMLENSARQQGDLGFQAFNSAVPDPLKRVDSMLEQSVGAPDTTVAGILTGVGSVMLSATGPQIPAAGELADRRRMVVRSDLSYYVQNYHCALPDEFLRYMEARGWNPPVEIEIDMKSLLGDSADAGTDEFIKWKEKP